MPIQRIPKYELIIGELIKNTNPEYEDYEFLCKTKNKMVQMNSFINEENRKSNLFNHVKNIKKNGFFVTKGKHSFTKVKLKEPENCDYCKSHVW